MDVTPGARASAHATGASVAVVTDSTACLPPDLVKRYGIGIAALNLVVDGRSYRDGIDITSQQFYQLLQRSQHPPTTAPSSPGLYLELFKQVSGGERPIICITVSPAFSSMHESARAAAELAREQLPRVRITVLDSGTAAMAQGFVVLEAARAAAAGCDLEGVLARAQAVKPRVRLFAMVDTLAYLARSGRVPRAAAWVSHLLQIKPIIQLLPGGGVSLAQRTRTKSRAIKRLLGLVEEAAGGQPIHAAVMHANVPEEAVRLQAQLAERLRCLELYLTEFTPAMGAHTGPGLLGVAFYPHFDADPRAG